MRSNNKASSFPPSPAPAPTPSPSILFRSGALPCRSGNSSTPARQGLSDELGPFQGVGSRPGLGSREPGALPPTALQPDVLARVRSCLGNSRLHATLVGVVLLAWSFWPANRHEPLYGIILCRGSGPGAETTLQREEKAMAGRRCERDGFGAHRAQSSLERATLDLTDCRRH